MHGPLWLCNPSPPSHTLSPHSANDDYLQRIIVVDGDVGINKTLSVVVINYTLALRALKGVLVIGNVKSQKAIDV